MKKLLKIVLWLFLVCLVALLVSPVWLGPAAKALANAFVPRITGTAFNVDRIYLNVYTGSFELENMLLANPAGYEAAEAVKVGRLAVRIVPTSVLGDTLVINDITLADPFVSYLDDAEGVNNFDKILAQVNAGKDGKEAASPAEPAPAEKAETADATADATGAQRKVVIGHVAVTGVRVRYGMLTLPIPDIALSGIGADAGGVTFESAGLEIWERIRKSFTLDSMATALGGLTDSLTKGTGAGVKNAQKLLSQGTQGATKGAKAATEAVTGGAKATAEAVTGGARKATEAVTDGAKKATEALGNLFK